MRETPQSNVQRANDRSRGRKEDRVHALGAPVLIPLFIGGVEDGLRAFFDTIGAGMLVSRFGVWPVTGLIAGFLLVTVVMMADVSRFIPSIPFRGRSSGDTDMHASDDALVDEAIQNIRARGEDPTAEMIREEIDLIESGAGEKASIHTQLVQDEHEREISDTMAIAPNDFKVGDDDTFIVRNGDYVRGLVIKNYPARVKEGWLDRLLTDPADIRISMHINPRSPDAVMKQLDKKKARTKAQMNIKRQKGKVNTSGEQTTLKHIERITQGILNGDLSIFDFALYIEVVADDRDELEEITGRVKQHFKQVKGDVVAFEDRQKQLQQSIAPLCSDPVGNAVMFDTQALKTTFPFIEPTIAQDSGVLIGFHRQTGLPVIVDRYDGEGFDGNNMLISGVVGSGKSYFAKLETWRWAKTDPELEILIIDPVGGETGFDHLVDALNGQRISIGESGHVINPMAIEQTENDSGSKEFQKKVNSVRGILESAFDEEVTKAEQGILSRAIRFAYLEKGITPDPDTHSNPNPTLQDVLAMLKHISEGSTPSEFLDVPEDYESYIQDIEMDSDTDGVGQFEDQDRFVQRNLEQQAELAQRVFIALDDFQDGGQADFLNGESTVDIDNRVVQFDISGAVDKTDESLVMHVVLDWLYQRCKGTPVRNQVVLDEAHYMLRNEYAAEMLEIFIRHARHYESGLTMISQTVAEFVNNDHEAIFKQCDIRVLMRHKVLTQEEAEALGISNHQREYILNATTGSKADHSSALLQLGQFGEVRADIISNDLEHAILHDELDPWAYLFEDQLVGWHDIPDERQQEAFRHMSSEARNFVREMLAQEESRQEAEQEQLAGSEAESELTKGTTPTD